MRTGWGGHFGRESRAKTGLDGPTGELPSGVLVRVSVSAAAVVDALNRCPTPLCWNEPLGEPPERDIPRLGMALHRKLRTDDPCLRKPQELLDDTEQDVMQAHGSLSDQRQRMVGPTLGGHLKTD